jgi:hypothetical protein
MVWSGVLSEDVLTPELVLPVQFEEIWSRRKAMAPEQELMLAVLGEAAADIRRYRFAPRRDGQRLYWEAYNWMASEDTTWPFSFVNLCAILGLSAEALREELFDTVSEPAVYRRAA